MFWLGKTRGYFVDWLTQRWVQTTGKQVDLRQNEWLRGPVGDTELIGPDYFDKLALKTGLEVNETGESMGLLPKFRNLESEGFDCDAVSREIVTFYQNTSLYDIDLWSQWRGLFRPFGWLLAVIFSRRLQQLNVPLNPLETSRGMKSRVVQLIDSSSGTLRYTGWVRELHGTRKVLYVGHYTSCQPSHYGGPCLKVVFPLPNGNATVILKPVNREDGSLLLVSKGAGIGNPGFYFLVHSDDDTAWVRYVKAMTESIHVYLDADGVLRTDHTMRLFGFSFMKLHYRMINQKSMRDAAK